MTTATAPDAAAVLAELRAIVDAADAGRDVAGLLDRVGSVVTRARRRIRAAAKRAAQGEPVGKPAAPVTPKPEPVVLERGPDAPTVVADRPVTTPKEASPDARPAQTPGARVEAVVRDAHDRSAVPAAPAPGAGQRPAAADANGAVRGAPASLGAGRDVLPPRRVPGVPALPRARRLTALARWLPLGVLVVALAVWLGATVGGPAAVGTAAVLLLFAVCAPLARQLDRRTARRGRPPGRT